VERPSGLIKRGDVAQALEVNCAGLPKESRECFKRMSAFNWSKLFQDIILTSQTEAYSNGATQCHAILKNRILRYK
jgi:hypothetical protein